MKNSVIVFLLLVLATSCSLEKRLERKHTYKGEMFDIEIVKSPGDSVVLEPGTKYKLGKEVFLQPDENNIVARGYKLKPTKVLYFGN